MRVQYNGVELLQPRLVNLNMFPQLDPTNTDVILTRVEMELTFRWHPWATASNKANAAAPPFDSLGLSVRRLRQKLNQARGLLRIAVGADQVWQVPVDDPVTGQPRNCDPYNGPFPQVLSLSEITGETLGLGRWRCMFWLTGCSNILLSNRWTVESVTNDCGMTTRTISGTAVIRADAVNSPTLNNAADFSRWLVCPVPSGFRRGPLRKKLSEVGNVIHYQVADVEDPNPLGADGATVFATKFGGEATAGVVSKLKSWEEKAVGQLNPLNWFPHQIAETWVKVWGGKTADKEKLAKLAISIVQDRFPVGTICSCIATQGLGINESEGRWIKIAVVIIPFFGRWWNGVWNSIDFTRVGMNLANGFTLPTANLNRSGQAIILHGDPPTNETDNTYKNYNLPNDNRPDSALAQNHDTGVSGSWFGDLLTQTIQQQCNPPDEPPDNTITYDSPGLF